MSIVIIKKIPIVLFFLAEFESVLRPRLGHSVVERRPAWSETLPYPVIKGRPLAQLQCIAEGSDMLLLKGLPRECPECRSVQFQVNSKAAREGNNYGKVRTRNVFGIDPPFLPGLIFSHLFVSSLPIPLEYYASFGWRSWRTYETPYFCCFQQSPFIISLIFMI